jgi:hypothetical protein
VRSNPHLRKRGPVSEKMPPVERREARVSSQGTRRASHARLVLRLAALRSPCCDEGKKETRRSPRARTSGRRSVGYEQTASVLFSPANPGMMSCANLRKFASDPAGPLSSTCATPAARNTSSFAAISSGVP